MKFVIIIMITCLMQVSAASRAQRLTYARTNATIGQVFKEIKKQTGFKVLYTEEKLDDNLKINANFNNASLEEVLDACLKGKLLEYEIDQKTILIKEKEKSILENIIARFQAIDVRGKVVDSLGNGLAGATISVKGFKQSTQTAASGDFYLKNVDEGVVLVISYLGYVTKEQVASKEFNYVTLQLSTSKLDEVQIQAYGKTSRRLSTGNIVTIKADEIAKQPVNNPLLALMGRVPNLVITPSSGLPNGAVNLQIRGQNSLARDPFTGSRVMTEPLIVIDGVPVQNNISAGPSGSFGNVGEQLSSLGFLNVNDIEQIDVLSDADATSIYGSRGGSGVIIITTKKGKVGPTQINVSIQGGINQMPKKLRLLNTSEYLDMRRLAYSNDNLALPFASMDPALKNTSNYDLSLWDQTRYTDWQEEFLGKSARYLRNYITISGGTEFLQYSVSGSYNKQRLIGPADNSFNGGTTNLNITGMSGNRKFKVQIGGSYEFNSSVAPGNNFLRLAMTLAPNAPSIYNELGNLNWENNPLTKEATWENPYAQLLRISKNHGSSLRGTSNLSYEVSKNLNLTLNAGYTKNEVESRYTQPIASYDPIITTSTGFASSTTAGTQTFSIEPQLRYTQLFSKHNINFLAGSSYQGSNEVNLNSFGYNYTSDALLNSFEFAGQKDIQNASSEYKYLAGFARLNYSFDDKYVANLSGRIDGSSKFGPGNQYGKFWSVGAAWIFTKEHFLKDLSRVLSFGKLRMSYGSSGNDNIGNYRYLELYRAISEKRYQDENFTLLSSEGAINSNYHWEDIRKLDLGIEAGFLDDRAIISATYWRTKGYDQLGGLPLPATAGASSITLNQKAVIQNSGWDFLIQLKSKPGKTLKWSTDANFGTSQSKLIYRPENGYDGYGFGRFIKVGQPFSDFVTVYESKGVNGVSHMYQFADYSGNASTDREGGAFDAKKINTRPITLGLNNSFSYNSFSFTFFVQLTKQVSRNYLYDRLFTIYSPGSFTSSGGLEFGNQPYEFYAGQLDSEALRFQKLTSSTTAEPMRPLITKAALSDLAYVDASFIKVRNATFSYTIDKGFARRINMSNVRFYIQGQNLFTFTNYKGFDPEIPSLNQLPQLRTVIFGIQLGL